jgi:hypothetical protein
VPEDIQPHLLPELQKEGDDQVAKRRGATRARISCLSTGAMAEGVDQNSLRRKHHCMTWSNIVGCASVKVDSGGQSEDTMMVGKIVRTGTLTALLLAGAIALA